MRNRIIEFDCQHIYVTDNGEAVEPRSAFPRVISYIPYGEIFVEQQSGGWQSPYLFNAKELDSETGLYYYGARYLDPTSAAWLSVDPLWEKNVAASPYNYCHGNPITMVDPNGMDEYEVNPQGYVKKTKECENHIIYAIDKEGKRTGESMKLSKNQLQVVKDLMEKRDEVVHQQGYSDKKHELPCSYAVSKSKDASSLYCFLADASTDAEWGLDKFSNGDYVLRTAHWNDVCPTLYNKNKNDSHHEFKLIFSIHSHPDNDDTRGGSHVPGYGGDISIVRRFANRYFKEFGSEKYHASFPYHYVYHRATKTLYQYGPYLQSGDKGIVKGRNILNNMMNPYSRTGGPYNK